MVKLLSVFLFFMAVHARAVTPCTFKRILHVEVSGPELPLELKNKILNTLDPDKVYSIKENKELAIKVCTSFLAMKDKTEFFKPTVADRDEHLLVKVDFSKQNLFWIVKMESFKKTGTKGLSSIATLDALKSPKPIADLKNADAADWINLKLFEISKR